MKKEVEIKCDTCGGVAFKWANPDAKTMFGRRWHFPSGWAVTLPHGWLCPKCELPKRG